MDTRQCTNTLLLFNGFYRLRRTSSDTGSSLYDRILRWSDKPSNLWKDDDCSSREQSARSRRSLMANRKISVQSSEFCESPIPINEDTDDYKIDKNSTETGKTFDSRQMQRRRRMGVYSKDEGLGPDILNTTEPNDNTTQSSEIENGLHSEEQEAELSSMEKNKSESNSECSHTNNNKSSESGNQSSESGIFTRSSDSSSINDIVDQELQKAFSPAIGPESDKRRPSRGQRGEKVSWTELPPKISDFIPRHPISTLKRRFSNLTASTATQFTSKGYLKRTTNDNKCQLPSWCVYLAYILCFVLASLSIGVIIGVGHSFTVTIATKWALAVIIATSISALVLESLKVLIIAVLLAIMKRGTTLSDDDVEISPLIESNETIKDLKCRPVGGFALHHAREEAEKLRRMHALLRQFVVYVLFIWLVMVVNYVDNHTERYRLSESLKNQITHPQNLSQRFTTIKRKDEFWNWLHHGIVDSIYNESEPGENAYTFVLGPPRLLQTRSKNVKCKATSAVPPLNATRITQRPCYGSHTWVESTEHYGIGWNSSISQNYTWRYSTQGDTETYGIWGEWGWYNGGGYVQLLPLSSDEAHQQLNTLEKQNWIDRGTRAVITEFTVYNNNRDLYSSVRLLAEFSLTGEVISSIDIQVVSYQKFILGKVNATLICQMLLIAVVLYLCGYIIMSIIEEKKLYFTHLSNWLDLAIVTSATATIVLYIYNMVNSTNLFSRYTSNTGSFMSLSWLANGIYIWTCMNGVLVFLLMIKVVIQLRFVRCISVHGKCLQAAAKLILGTTILLLILTLAYASLGFLTYGATHRAFRSFWMSMFTLFGILRGKLKLMELCIVPNCSFTHFYFMTYVSTVYIVFGGLLVAVIVNTYKTIRSQMHYYDSMDIHDYDMVEFFMKRFKLWAGISKPKPAFRKVKFQGLQSLSTQSSRHSTPSVRTESEQSYSDASSVHSELLNDRLTSLWEQTLEKLDDVDELDKCEEYLCEHLFEISQFLSKDDSQDYGSIKTSTANNDGANYRKLSTISMCSTQYSDRSDPTWGGQLHYKLSERQRHTRFDMDSVLNSRFKSAGYTKPPRPRTTARLTDYANRWRVLDPRRPLSEQGPRVSNRSRTFSSTRRAPPTPPLDRSRERRLSTRTPLTPPPNVSREDSSSWRPPPTPPQDIVYREHSVLRRAPPTPPPDRSRERRVSTRAPLTPPPNVSRENSASRVTSPTWTTDRSREQSASRRPPLAPPRDRSLEKSLATRTPLTPPRLNTNTNADREEYAKSAWS